VLAAALPLLALLVPQAVRVGATGDNPGLVADNRSFGSVYDIVDDVDGDGCADYVVGNRRFHDGQVLVYSGKTGDLLRTIWSPPDETEFARYLFKLCDGRIGITSIKDERPMLGVYCVASGERERVVVGGPDEVTLTGAVPVRVPGRQPGIDLIVLGKQRDGHARLGAISRGERAWHLDLPEDGDVRLFPLEPNGGDRFAVSSVGRWVRVYALCPMPSVQYEIVEPYPSFGHDVIGLGDVDRDYRGDLAVSCPEGPRFASEAGGRVFVYSGLRGEKLAEIAGARGIGHGIAAVSDMDGDSIPDLACTYYGMFEGGVSVYPGRSLGLREAPPARFFRALSELGPPDTGWDVKSGGDLDGDGVWDLIVSVWSPFSSSPSQGIVLFSGRKGDLIRRHEVRDFAGD
jgi:hypothetical protein